MGLNGPWCDKFSCAKKAFSPLYQIHYNSKPLTYTFLYICIYDIFSCEVGAGGGGGGGGGGLKFIFASQWY